MTGRDELAHGDILRDLEVMLDAITDYAIVWLDATGTVTRWSPGAEAVLGYSADEVVGRHVSIFYPDEDRARGAVEVSLETSATCGRFRFEGVRIRKGGTRFSARGVNTSLHDQANGLRGYVTVIQDITEWRRHQVTEARLAAIARSSDDAMCSLTLEEVIDACNGGAERLFGYTQAEIVGRPIRVLVPEQEREKLDRVVGRLRAGEHVVRYDTFRRRKDGSLVEVAVSLSAMRDPTGALLGYAAVWRDLEEWRRAEAELRAAQAREQLLEERERIARDLHDLVIQRVFAAGMTLEATRALTREEQVAIRLERVIEDLDATIREIRSTIYALGHPGASLRSRLLRIISEAAQHLGFEPKVELVGPIDAGVAPEVAEQVVAAAREALSNVVRHAQASSAEIELHAGDHITLVVSDDGRGMGDAARRSGLANLARRAEALCGSLVIESTTGAGTRLVWQVPVSTGPGQGSRGRGA